MLIENTVQILVQIVIANLGIGENGFPSCMNSDIIDWRGWLIFR